MEVLSETVSEEAVKSPPLTRGKERPFSDSTCTTVINTKSHNHLFTGHTLGHSEMVIFGRVGGRRRFREFGRECRGGASTWSPLDSHRRVEP